MTSPLVLIYTVENQIELLKNNFSDKGPTIQNLL